MATLIPIEVNNTEGIPLELEERMVKEGTDNYENLQNLPTLNGKIIKGNINEKDPTVPEWAKEPTKPKYTAEEVGATTSDEVNEMISEAIKDKVDKVNGKGLSSNDYTDAEKDKLASVEEGATANVGTITGIKLNGEVKGTSGVVNLGNVVTDKSDKLDKNQGRENSGKYMKVDIYGNLIPAEVQGGGGGSYTQGDGISIVNDVISVNNTIARKTDIPVIPKVPTKTSELTNDSNFVADANYEHIDDAKVASWGYVKESGSDYSEGDGINITDKVISVDDTIARKSDIPVIPPIPEVPTKTSDLVNDSDFVSDVNYTHVDEALVASWGFSKGGGGAVNEVTFSTTGSDQNAIRFGIDENGNYGFYKVGADSVTPFKSGSKAEFVNNYAFSSSVAIDSGEYFATVCSYSSTNNETARNFTRIKSLTNGTCTILSDKVNQKYCIVTYHIKMTAAGILSFNNGTNIAIVKIS